MTPAEKLAKEKKKRLPKKSTRSKVVFDCNLRDIRHKHGLSQRDVARAIGRSDAILCGIEKGADLQLTTAILLADFFGKTIREIWNPKGPQ